VDIMADTHLKQDHVPMEIMREGSESVENFAVAMKKITTNNNKTLLKTSVKTLLSTLQNLQKKNPVM